MLSKSFLYTARIKSGKCFQVFAEYYLDDGSAASNTFLLFEIAADDQAQGEEQAGRQQTGGGELTIRN